jgi:hypothetical protein
MSLIYAGTKIAPVYLDKADFERGLVALVQAPGALEKSDEEILGSIQALARDKSFVVSGGDVWIERSLRSSASPEIGIELCFRRPVEFPGYVHQFAFEFAASSASRSR